MQTSARPLALLGEVLLIGVLVSIASLPIVTCLGAAAAGATSLREFVESDRTPTARRFVSLFGAALRDPVALLAPPIVLAVAAIDLLAVLGGLPGARLFGPVLGLLLAATVVIGLRASARWRIDARWRALLSDSATVAARDWVGSIMLAAGVLITVIIVIEAPGFVVVLPGLLVMASVSVERRLSA